MLTIQGYQVTEQISQSRRSLVYRGYRQSDRQPVVLKMLQQAYPPPEVIAQFKREVRALVALNHPNILAITLTLFSSLGIGAVDQSAPVFAVSPDGELRIEFSLHNVGQAVNAPHYCVFFGDREIVAHSRLGVELAGGTTLVIRRR